MRAREDLVVREKTPDDQKWVEQLLLERWGSTRLVVHGRSHDGARLPALVAGDREGLATYVIEDEGELISLDAVTMGQGVGTALIAELSQRLKASGIRRLWVTTTNDNLRAYQTRGFRLARLHPGAVDESRRLKPSISAIGQHGIPIRDEIELCLDLND